MAEGFGSNYAEQLAKQVFDHNPNINNEDDALNLGYSIAKDELGSRARGIFRDEDFPSDFVSAYNWLKKQENDMDERSGQDTTVTHKGGIVTKTKHGIKHTKTDYDDEGLGWKGKDKTDFDKSPYKKFPILDKDDEVNEADVVSKISAATAKDVTIDNPDGTKTVVPMATGMLSKDEQGNLVLNKAAAAQASQQAAAGGAQQQPIKPGQQVRVTTEPSEDIHRVSAMGGEHGDEVTDTNTKSAISGDEEHDEVTKLLVKRLRKLAGLDRMTDETAQESDNENQ